MLNTLIFGNKISINMSQVCQISHKFMNYDHHETTQIIKRQKCRTINSHTKRAGGSLTVTVAKTLMSGNGGSSTESYFADPTSPIPSHCNYPV